MGITNIGREDEAEYIDETVESLSQGELFHLPYTLPAITDLFAEQMDFEIDETQPQESQNSISSWNPTDSPVSFCLDRCPPLAVFSLLPSKKLVLV
jgi:hypothetical protein